MRRVNHRLPNTSTIIDRVEITISGMGIGDRLKELRESEQLTQPQMAEIVGTTKQYVSQLEGGKNQTPNGQFLEGWARHFRVSLRWLATGQGPKVTITRRGDGDDDTVDIPGYAHELALGDGSTPEEYAESHKLKFRASSLRRKGLLGRRLEVYYGRGDSMEPRIHDGDAILVDRDDQAPKDGEIFVLEGHGGAMAKRLTNIDGRWFFESDNKAEPKWRKPTPLDGKHSYTIVGRVRWIGSWEG
jgi:phage repressor protein C with HTH and peptisase S24 domain